MATAASTDWEVRMEQRSLYYMASLRHALPISMMGIISRNAMEASDVLRGVEAEGAIADPEVNTIRHRRSVGGRSLHDFVPLYWGVKTPMQYVITVRPGRIDPDQLVIFELDADAVLELPGIWTTDGNAACHDTRFFEGAAGLSHVDWKIVAHPVCLSPEWRRKKAAEVLVPDSIPLKLIRKACLRSPAAADTFIETRRVFAAGIRKAGIAVPRFPKAEARPQLFF